MIKSMTGFGRSKYENDQREYIIEIKTVNHRYLDINIKLPRNIAYLEEKIKKEIQRNISRGKVDVYIGFTNNSALKKNISINKEIATMYINELQKLQEISGINQEIPLSDIIKHPVIWNISDEDDEEIIWEEMQIPLQEAIDSLISMRQIEGNKIAEDLELRNKAIKEKINEISRLSTGLIDEYVVKLEGRVKELLKTEIVDQTRLATEVVIYADKCSIEEEITRLKSHTEQFNELLKQDVVGKKIDFLIQEMNRETNTIASKANCLEITNIVIELKTELENMREQIQNIE